MGFRECVAALNWGLMSLAGDTTQNPGGGRGGRLELYTVFTLHKLEVIRTKIMLIILYWVLTR